MLDESDFLGAEEQPPAPTPTPEEQAAQFARLKQARILDVKHEARRRILALCPEWKQANLTARAAELAIKGPGNWTEAETAEHAAGQAIWDQIKALRAASNAAEAAILAAEDEAACDAALIW